MDEDQIRKAEEEGLAKRFKMTSQISTSNMVCFDMEGRIRKYSSAESILTDFYDLRLSYYQKRKENMANNLKNEWDKCDNRVRFIRMIIEGKLVIQNRKKKDILIDLKAKGFNPHYPKKDAKKEDDEDNEEAPVEVAKEGSDHGYDYLLSMPIWNLTIEKVEKLIQERNAKDAELKEHLKKSPKELWSKDLDNFIKEWENILLKYEKRLPKGKATSKGKTGPVRRKLKDASDEDDDFSTQGDDDDFAPTKSKAASRAAVASKSAAAKEKKIPAAKKDGLKGVSTVPATKQTSITSFAKKVETVAKPPPQYDEIDSDDSLEMSFADKLDELKKAKLNPKQDLVHPRSPVTKMKAEDEGMDSPAHKKKRTFNVDLLSDQLSDVNFNDEERPKPGVNLPVRSLTKMFSEIESKPEVGKMKQVTTKKTVVKSKSKQLIIPESDDEDVVDVTTKSRSKSIPKEASDDDDSQWDIPAPLPVKVKPGKKEPTKASATVTAKASAKSKKAATPVSSDDDESVDERTLAIEPRASRPVRAAARAAVNKSQYVEFSDGDQVDDVSVDTSEFESDY
ncbi:DNA topoisomerase [Jimgerdemannia flammicorona]|uniref:DNA topoisomerase (ATP-hydrolyzing) n=1 Tax=Jimgerdemannia flammicorona TaxID=994334 RepID=A0A433Q2R7_9FUNG|nr:DNA topoisomerase [Jimgerdemannia flammicorona]